MQSSRTPNQLPEQFDLLIVGGGPVGGALAMALADLPLRVALLEARSEPVVDVRALALSDASRVALDGLGLWPDQCQEPGFDGSDQGLEQLGQPRVLC